MKNYPQCKGCNPNGNNEPKLGETCSKCNGNWLAGQRLTAKRVADNAAILTVLTQYLEANPSIRFNQALINLDINLSCQVNTEKFGRNNYVVDDYYTEPGEILKRMKV